MELQVIESDWDFPSTEVDSDTDEDGLTQVPLEVLDISDEPPLLDLPSDVSGVWRGRKRKARNPSNVSGAQQGRKRKARSGKPSPGTLPALWGTGTPCMKRLVPTSATSPNLSIPRSKNARLNLLREIAPKSKAKCPSRLERAVWIALRRRAQEELKELQAQSDSRADKWAMDLAAAEEERRQSKAEGSKEFWEKRFRLARTRWNANIWWAVHGWHRYQGVRLQPVTESNSSDMLTF